MNRDYYARLLDGLGDGALERYDREESGTGEDTQGGGSLTFSALERERQIDILSAIGENLPTRTGRPNGRTGTSYDLKHIIERYTGFYVSNLQAKTAMRVLGYLRGGDDLNPFYNVTVDEWRAFNDLSRELHDRRRELMRRMRRQDEQRAAARYFHNLTRTA